MSDEFSAEETKELIQAARIFCPGFDEQKFQSIMELERHFADSGYLETVSGLSRLEEERGVTINEALDSYEELLADVTQLEEKAASYCTELTGLQTKIGQAEDEYKRGKEAIEQAEGKLHRVQGELQKEEKDLIAFRKDAERQRKRIAKELEEHQRGADVTKREIDSAHELKELLASRGFTIQLVLDLCQEFVDAENAREKLGKAIEEHETLTKSNTALTEQGEALKKEIESRQAEVRSFEEKRDELQSVISRFQADIAHEEELRKFYHRYQSAAWLMEYLASWKEIYFMRCNNPLFAITGALDHRTAGARFCVEKPPTRRCPCCGYPDAVYDPRFYQTFNLPPGTPVKLQLGE
jgi:chromosome segregation ATPase